MVRGGGGRFADPGPRLTAPRSLKRRLMPDFTQTIGPQKQMGAVFHVKQSFPPTPMFSYTVFRYKISAKNLTRKYT